MIKYHKNIYIPEKTKEKTISFIEYLNKRKKVFSFHAKEEILKEVNFEAIAKTIIEYSINYDDIFEIVENKYNNIEKIGLRIPFNGQKDIIFIIDYKSIIKTAWTNNILDKHFTLDKSKYYCLKN